MKKLIGLAVCAVALFAGKAYAAPTDINLVQQETSPGSGVGTDQWDLSLSITDQVSIGAIAFLVDGATNFVFNPALTTAPGNVISLADSVNAQDGTARHVAGNPPNFGQVMFQGPASGSPPVVVLIGTFTAPIVAGCSKSNLGPCPAFLSSAPDGGSIQTPDFIELPSATHVIPAAPEPMTAVLLGFGLAGIAMIRRKAA